jgi:hypothetical protein
MTPTTTTDWPYLTGTDRIRELVRSGCSDSEIMQSVGGQPWEIAQIRDDLTNAPIDLGRWPFV